MTIGPVVKSKMSNKIPNCDSAQLAFLLIVNVQLTVLQIRDCWLDIMRCSHGNHSCNSLPAHDEVNVCRRGLVSCLCIMAACLCIVAGMWFGKWCSVCAGLCHAVCRL